MKKNSFLKFLIKIIKVICTVVIVLVASVVFVQRISNNKVNLGGFGIYTIVSESMAPEYNLMDMIISKKVDASTLRVGDDVVYLGEKGDFNGRTVTHRIVKIRNTVDGLEITTKGLANSIEDPSIRPDQVLGKVVYKSVVLSFLSSLLNNIYTLYFVVFLPICIMIFFEILATVKDKKELDKE